MIKHFVVSAVIFNQKAEVLLVKHKKHGVWVYPGGHLEKNESPDEGVLREVKEETGLIVEIVDRRYYSLESRKDKTTVLHRPKVVFEEIIERAGKQHCHLDLVYHCRVAGRENYRHNKDESEGIGFFKVSEIDDLAMFDHVRILVKKLSGK